MKHLREIGQPIKCHCCPHIETSQLICIANQLTGFYISATLAFHGLMLVLTTVVVPELINADF